MVLENVLQIGAGLGLIGGAASIAGRDASNVNFLQRPTVLGQNQGVRTNFVVADKRAIDRERRKIISNFGFEDTISEPKRQFITLKGRGKDPTRSVRRDII